ncbi:MAG: protocatechuate 3,4-dioxygenase [Pirellulaceae bacterium]|nr:intradiol ring-cleavage dioxygenase [Planctomycetales bacterium]MCA9163817.1 intradiol ring-cleavage dioxygenase [Planctomycetales bacterium]
MNRWNLSVGRRQFLQSTAFAAAAFSTPGVFAEELMATAAMTEGPFYPDKMPLDTDNDLLVINDAITPAVGEITHLSGRVLGPSGKPIRNAFIEIWQVDNHGAYLHSGTDNSDKRDTNFQGYGRFLTDAQGRYYFRTIKPVPYPGRTPHIHVGISKNGQRIFTTQLLVKGHPGNERDGLVRSIRDPKALETLMVDFKPLPDSAIGELTASFDVVLGRTVEEDERGGLKGVGQPVWNRRGGVPGPPRPRRDS